MVFFRFLKLYKRFQIAQNITYEYIFAWNALEFYELPHKKWKATNGSNKDVLEQAEQKASDYLKDLLSWQIPRSMFTKTENNGMYEVNRKHKLGVW